MPSIPPVNETREVAPAGAASGGPGQAPSARPPLMFTPPRKGLLQPYIGDLTLALRALAVSYGIIFGAGLLIVPGAAVLAAAAFWHPALVLTWQTSLGISLGISVVLLIVLTILSALIGGRAFPFFVLLALAALVTLGVVHHRDAALVDALWNHLTR